MSDLSDAMKKLHSEVVEIFTDPRLPDFSDQDVVQAVSDLELARPISDLLTARNWYLADEDKRPEATVEILKAISALERGLLARWQDL